MTREVLAGELEQALRSRGIRITRQRMAILKVLVDSDDHPDADELHRRVREINPAVSLSTVYRTLTALAENDLVHRHAFEGVAARFETTDAPHHDHLIDLDTDTVIEFRSPEIEEL